MYCLLDDAFTPLADGKGYASCWQQAPVKPVAAEDKEEANEAPAAVGASAQQVCAPSPGANVTDAPPCMQYLHHCLQCPICARMLRLHFEDEDRSRRRRRRRVVGGTVTRNSMGMELLNEPINEGTNITWGNVLVLLAGGALLLLLVRALK